MSDTRAEETIPVGDLTPGVGTGAPTPDTGGGATTYERRHGKSGALLGTDISRQNQALLAQLAQDDADRRAGRR